MVGNRLQFPALDTQESYSINLQSSGRSLKSISENLVDMVWTDRPQIPEEALTILPDRVIGGLLTHTRTWGGGGAVCLSMVAFISILINTCKQTAISELGKHGDKEPFCFYGRLTYQTLTPDGASQPLHGRGSCLDAHASKPM